MRKPNKLPEDKPETLGKRIEYLRRNMGLSQEELATKLGVTRTKISCVERDIPNRQLNISELNQLADIFCVSTDYILGRTNAKEMENYEISHTFGFSDESINKIIKLNNGNNNIVNVFIENTDLSLFWKNFSDYVYISEIISKLSKIEYSEVPKSKGEAEMYLKFCIDSILNTPIKKTTSALHFNIDIESKLEELIFIVEKFQINLNNNKGEDVDSLKLFKDINTSNYNSDSLHYYALACMYDTIRGYLHNILIPLVDIAELQEYKITKYINYVFQKVNPDMPKTDYKRIESILKKL